MNCDLSNYRRSFALHSKCADSPDEPTIKDYFRIESRTLLFHKGIFICGLYLAGTHHAENIETDAKGMVIRPLATLTILYASLDLSEQVHGNTFVAAAGENTRHTREGIGSSFTGSFQFNRKPCSTDDWGDASLNLHFLKQPRPVQFDFVHVRAAVESGNALIARVATRTQNSDLTQIVEAPVQVGNFAPNNNNLLSLGLFMIPWVLPEIEAAVSSIPQRLMQFVRVAALVVKPGGDVHVLHDDTMRGTFGARNRTTQVSCQIFV